MTKAELIETLRNAPTKEVGEGIFKVNATPIFIAYNDKESWTFHAIEVGGIYSFVASQMIPKGPLGIKIDEVPDYVLDMAFDWSDNIHEKYGNIITAMNSYKESYGKFD